MTHPLILLRTPLSIAILAVGAVLAAAIVATTAYVVAGAREVAVERAYGDVGRIARAFEDQTERTLQGADSALTAVRDAYVRDGARLAVALPRPPATDEGFDALSIVDERGEVVTSTPAATGAPPRDLSAAAAEASADRLHVGAPLPGPQAGAWSIPLSRRIERADGSLAAVVRAAVAPRYFARYNHAVDVGAHGAVVLVGRDGIVRARRTALDMAAGQDLRATPQFDALRGVGGAYRAVSAIDGTERYYGYRLVRGYPLYAVAGIAADDALAPYAALRREAWGIAGVALAAVFAATALLLVLALSTERARRRAERTNRLKTDFLADMSHELRTPLTGILGYADLLREDLSGTAQQAFADAIRDSGRHLLILVNDLLDVAKAESGRTELALAELDVGALVRGTVAAHVAAAQAKDLELRVDVMASVPASIRCDRTILVRVLNNLLHNAIKFTDEGHVDVTVTRRLGELAFSIADTGVGIPPELHEAVFDKFVQVAESAARPHEGTGLGLTLCRDLVTLMGGRIWVRSTPGQGATFSFTLPLPADAHGEPQASGASA